MKQDPYYQREASIYVKPVASRELLLQIIIERTKPISLEQLLKKLSIADPDQIEGLRRRLKAMVRDGQIRMDTNKKIQTIDRGNLKKGRIQGKKDTTGCCVFSDGSEPLLIRAQQMRQVFDGDLVLVNEHLPIGEQPEGIIVEIIERNTQSLVGNFYRTDDSAYVVPMNRRNQHITIKITGDAEGLEEGELVKINIDQQPGITTMAQGHIVSALNIYSTGQELDIALLNHRLRHEWSQDILREVEKIPKKINSKEIEKRFDLRDMAFITIDGDDSRDFDDAVYCQKEKSGFRLWVSIADVSHYVQPGSALDTEAMLRGNSVYFPSAVIPMLPEQLSNGICSLNPDQDRLALVCEMRISAKGSIVEYWFFEAVFRSHARLTYDQVATALQQDNKPEWSEEVNKNLLSLEQSYQAFLNGRNKRGALAIELPEVRFIFAGTDIKNLTRVHRNIAHKIIEEAMVAANVCAAQLLAEHSIPTLYRVHNDPDPERVTEFRRYLKLSGLRLDGGHKPQARHFLKLLKQLSDFPQADVIYMQLLRTMSKAAYTPEQRPHFGLACQKYCHFTSPIRRYPDLLVHRAIGSLIHSRRHANGIKRIKGAGIWQNNISYPYDIQNLIATGLHCSDTEVRAEHASRDVQQYLRCIYLQQFLGKTFDGLVKTVTSFGLFIEMSNTCSEGLLHVSTLSDDYYIFDSETMTMRGERTGTTYTPGSLIKVRLVRVDIERGMIDLEPIRNPKIKTGEQSKKSSVRKAKKKRIQSRR